MSNKSCPILYRNLHYKMGKDFLDIHSMVEVLNIIVIQKYVQTIEKGISIEYPYNFGLPLDNSAFVIVLLEFDLLVRTIVQSKWNTR